MENISQVKYSHGSFLKLQTAVQSLLSQIKRQKLEKLEKWYLKKRKRVIKSDDEDDDIPDMPSTISSAALVTAYESMYNEISTNASDNINGFQYTRQNISVINQEAMDYAEENAADLITNIDETTMSMISGDILDALQNGDSWGSLSKVLQDNYAFSRQRSELIARTESKIAMGQGNLSIWKKAGVKGKQWLLSNDENECSDCSGNEDDGVIGIDEEFSDGSDTTPSHPHCQCSVIAVNGDEE